MLALPGLERAGGELVGEEAATLIAAAAARFDPASMPSTTRVLSGVPSVVPPPLETIALPVSRARFGEATGGFEPGPPEKLIGTREGVWMGRERGKEAHAGGKAQGGKSNQEEAESRDDLFQTEEEPTEGRQHSRFAIPVSSPVSRGSRCLSPIPEYEWTGVKGGAGARSQDRLQVPTGSGFLALSRLLPDRPSRASPPAEEPPPFTEIFHLGLLLLRRRCGHNMTSRGCERPPCGPTHPPGRAPRTRTQIPPDVAACTRAPRPTGNTRIEHERREAQHTHTHTQATCHRPRSRVGRAGRAEDVGWRRNHPRPCRIPRTRRSQLFAQRLEGAKGV